MEDLIKFFFFNSVFIRIKHLQMKSIIALLLASVFIFQSAGKLIVIANYSINKEYISKNFCENKAKPKLHCNGKCHLKKELQKEDKKENTPSNNVKEKQEIQYYSETNSITICFFTKEETKWNIYHINSDYNKHLFSVFHPPQA